MSDERQRVADELRRVRDRVRETPSAERDIETVLPAARETKPLERAPAVKQPQGPPEPSPPDAGPVNEGWDLTPHLPGGLIGRLVRRVLGPVFAAQSAFNSRQVQLDNGLLEYVNARSDRTHRHYDEVLGIHGTHMEEIDQRHLLLQEDLVAHVHDLVKRIDLVLAEGERSRLSLELALKDLRGQLIQFERRVSAK